MLLEMQGNPERPRQAFRRRTVVLFVALLASMALLWYLDWILPAVHLGPIAALPLLIVAYLTGARLAVLIAAVAAIAFAVADAGLGSRNAVMDLVVDSATLFVAFLLVTLLAGRWRAQERQVAALRESVETEKHRAEHDTVTGLTNRASFNRSFEDAVTRARATATSMGVLIVDVDRFKEINDRHGHAAGDFVLAEVARRLAACVRESDTVARIGGDEFALIVQPVVAGSDVVQLQERLSKRVAAPVLVGGGLQLDVGISVGYGLFPHDGEDFSALFQIADRRMYESKRRSRGRASGLAAFKLTS
jgi:diguanylate cyclase (GGDEF)-like protein